MKLYTEYNLKEVYFKGLENGRKHIDGGVHSAIDSQEPIELPSDEEIDKYIEKTFYGVKKHYFKAGVEYMKELILNQNK